MILFLSVVGFIVTLFEMFWKEILIGLIIILLLTPDIYYLVSKYGGRASPKHHAFTTLTYWAWRDKWVLLFALLGWYNCLNEFGFI